MAFGLDAESIRLEPSSASPRVVLGGGISGTELVLRYAQLLAYLLALAVGLFLWMAQDLWPSRQEIAVENLVAGRQALGRLPQMPDYFEFVTTGCFGACSVYSMRIDADGQVTFHGMANTCAKGLRVRRIAPEMARRLLAAGEVVDWSQAVGRPIVWDAQRTRLQAEFAGGRRHFWITSFASPPEWRPMQRLLAKVQEVAMDPGWLPSVGQDGFFCQTQQGSRKTLDPTPTAAPDPYEAR